jgi:NADPH-dependent glutamate synthase beta subunit-like oxidoreductase
LALGGFFTPINVNPSNLILMESLRGLILSNRIQEKNMASRKVPACWATCPASVRAHGYVGLIAQRKFDVALNLVRRENPLPGIAGRVCDHPCEEACERRKIDEGLAIAYLKRFVADYERKTNPTMPSPVKQTKKEKIAIVGSGPAGLTAAYHLIRKGYGVTIFEALPVLGGMLVTGIPPNRLPRDVIAYEIDRIKALGVEMKTGVTVGHDVSFSALFEQGYASVFVAIGAYESRKLGIPGEDEYSGFMDCLAFLQNVNLGDRTKPGENVCIIGGGNAAIDAARTALRLGCDNVTIVYRRSRIEMPANAAEIEEAIAEGVQIHYLASPVRIIGENNSVTAMECIQNKLGEPDASGRRRPVPVEGSEFIVEADTIIPAISQRPDVSFLPDDHGFDLTRWNTFNVNPHTLQTNLPGIFAGGDCVTGPATVIEAIAAGRKAADVIDRHLQGKELTIEESKPSANIVRLTETEITKFETKLRQRMPKLPLSARQGNFEEVELGFSEEMAVQEANRCLKCWTLH